jgi:hypothetical protein
MMTATLDLIVNMYRLIPPSARGLWKCNGSTSHRAYGGWEPFRNAITDWGYPKPG